MRLSVAANVNCQQTLEVTNEYSKNSNRSAKLSITQELHTARVNGFNITT